MSPFKPYLSASQAPGRADLDALRGLALLEFGTEWCGHCRAAQPLVADALAQHAQGQGQGQGQFQHIKIEDGPGRPLGRSYRVRLWPTLVLLRDGQEMARLVRPSSPQDMVAALQSVINMP